MKMSPLLSVFSEAVEIRDPEARAAYLERACEGDSALRSRVDELLALEPRTGRFLADPSASPRRDIAAETPGGRIGRYRLLEPVGQGGYGVVYRAEQEEPVRRQVALKVIKRGMDTGAVVARFEAERQALAVMDHPNIARVFDAGTTEAGRPYFVMELVSGLPITSYCRQHSLTVRQRLELVIHVCNGIQHAHQKGIIHRDLKPSNILVAEHDGLAVPKVIDFGIAKATDRAAAGPEVTEGHQFLGTPAYMSPEQVQGGSRDIDTRSDIYSLGVVLYELLTGHPPFDSSLLASAGFDEMRRLVRESDPPRPSARLTQERATVQRGRHPAAGQGSSEPAGSAPALLQRSVHEIRGDVDWIVMKCLEKDRARRYETANALAADIRRHLDNETIAARPPTALYRFQKVIRRNRVGFAAVATIALVLVAAVVVSSQLAVRARLAEQLANRRLAESRASEAKAAREESKANKQAAAERLARENADQASRFLRKMLTIAFEPGRDPKTITVAENLAAAARQLQDPALSPELRKELLLTLGQSYLSLNLPREAVPLLEDYRDYCLDAFGPDDRRAFEAHDNLAVAYYRVGRFGDAREIREDLLPRQRRVLGALHLETQITMRSLESIDMKLGWWNEAIRRLEERLANEALVSRESGEKKLVECYLAVGRNEDAIALQEKVLQRVRQAHGPQHRETVAAWEDLGFTCLQAGRPSEAGQHWAAASASQTNRAYDVKIAGLLVWFGHHPEHAAMSARLLATAGGGTASLGDLNCIAKIASLRPAAEPDTRDSARQLARRVVEQGKGLYLLPWFHLTLGMSEYRAGRYAEADRILDAAEKGAERSSAKERYYVQLTAQFYQAMSRVQQGKVSEARRILSSAAAGMRPIPANENSAFNAGASHDDLVLWLAYREATGLMEATVAAP